jgi:hypothetical protein
MKGNDFMAWVLRSPFHGMLSNGTMLITVTGRKTGKTYTTSRERTWWKNLQGGANVTLLLKRKPMNGFAETELEGEAVEALMYHYVKHIPQAAKPMGIRVENGVANAEDIARTAKDRLFVRIKLLN